MFDRPTGAQLLKGACSDLSGYAAGMREGETELEMVRRHVTAGAEHVAKQRALIGHLREAGRSTDEAETLLVRFQDIQRLLEEHLARLQNAHT